MELRDRQLKSEVYTIRQVAETTGVPENTIRSWERRFGIPQPARSGSNQRRYSERDVEMIRSIQVSRDRGRTMEQAIQDLDPEVPNHTNDASRAAPKPADRAVEPPLAPTASEDFERIVSALSKFDGEGAESIITDRMWGSTVEAACVDLLLPAAQAIDTQLAAGRISASQGALSRAWIHRKLLSALDHARPDRGRLPVIVASMHDVSSVNEALCLAIMVARAGYRVVWPGDSVSVAGIVELVDAVSPGAVALCSRSHLSTVAVEAAVEQLLRRRRAGMWNGVIAATGSVATSGGDVIDLPIHATRSVSTLEGALRAHDSSTIRLVKNP